MYNLIIENRKNICNEVKNKEKQKTYNYIKPENYLQIPGWAYEFPLNFSELAVYSIIYGFTQFVEGQWFTGTRRYLAEWLKCSVIKIQRVLNGLVEKGFLEKETWFQNDERHSKYRALPKYKNNNNLFSNEENLEDENFFCASENNLKGGSIKMIRGSIKMKHNITNNKTNYLINKKERKKEDPPQLSFEKINFKNEKIKNEENIFDPKIFSKKETEKTFNVLIEEFSQNEVLCFELKEHLKIRKLKKAPLTNHALELSFKRLDSLSNSDDEKIAIVQKSIENGWTGFFPLKPYEKTQIRSSAVSQNTSYNIDEYLKTMDTFAITPEAKKELERKRNDEIKKQEFYKSFIIGNTPEDQRELTPEEIEEEERDTKEFIKKINDSVGFTNEDIAAALEEQKRMENERRENCFWF